MGGQRASRMWSRRRVLGVGAAFVAAGGPAVASPSPEVRVVALDWGLASTALGLDAAVVGVAEQSLYRNWVHAPALPPDVAELGLRDAPSMETLAVLRPGLILINPLNESLRPRLEAIAPTFSNTIFAADRRPLDRAVATARNLGSMLNRAAQAEALIAGAEARLIAARARLADAARRPLIPVGFVDGRHIRIYGAGSLFGDVMARLGLANGFAGDTNAWGFALAGIEALADCPGTDILVIEPTPPEALEAIRRPGLWTSLIEASRSRVVTLPPVWAFGDITAAARCADVLAEALAMSRADRAG